jgi:hypothetical protein
MASEVNYESEQALKRRQESDRPEKDGIVHKAGVFTMQAIYVFAYVLFHSFLQNVVNLYNTFPF